MDLTLLEYYINLLILQYRNTTNAPAHMRALLTLIVLYDLIVQVRDGYDIDTSVGVQQDVLSKYIGVDRIVYGTAFSRTYWGFCEYGDVTPFTFGTFALYNETAPDVQFRTYENSKESLYALNDEELRFVQKLKILKNSSNASNKDIDDFINNFFGGNTIFLDKLNMKIEYIFDVTLQRLVTIAVSENLIPKPAAVSLLVSYATDITNIFSLILYGSTALDYQVGFASYGATAVGGFLTYGSIV